MKFTESQAEARPILAAPQAMRRKEILRASFVALLVFCVVGLMAAAVLVNGFGGRLIFGR